MLWPWLSELDAEAKAKLESDREVEIEAPPEDPVDLEEIARSLTAKGAAKALMGVKFSRALYATARHKAFYGGRGSAKSWSVATYLASRGAKEKKRIVCARQFQNSMRDSSKELIEKRILALGLARQYDSTDRAIVHKGTGTEFLFVGLERNIESIRSLEGADIVWIEEARTIKARSMEILLPTVREIGSEMIWVWNPEQPTDPVDAYFRKGTPPPRSIVTFVDWRDNPYFFQTELPQEMKTLRDGNYDRYKHVWLGEYDLTYQTKVFPNVTVGRVHVPANCPPRYGMDFGFSSDPSFIVKVYVLKDTIYIAAEASGSITIDNLPAMIRSVVNSDSDLIKADSSVPGVIENLQARGFNIHGAKKGPGSVKSGILFLQGFKIVIDPNCEAMREEARLYSWMTERLTGRSLNIPVDKNNHGWDATRYAVEDLMAMPDEDDDTGGVLKLKIW